MGLEPATYFAGFRTSCRAGSASALDIARALVYHTRLVVCDEPVSALDVSVQAQVVNRLRHLQAELQVAYVFVSHDLAVVGAISHEIAVMYLGRVVELGAARDVLRAPRHPYTQVLVESTNIPEPSVERARSPRLLSGELPSPLDPAERVPVPHPLLDGDRDLFRGDTVFAAPSGRRAACGLSSCRRVMATIGV